MMEKKKVVVYVISSRGLLVFAHGAHPEVGYQVPSGTVRERETPLAAAMRELKEETGLQADSDKFTKLGIFLIMICAHSRRKGIYDTPTFFNSKTRQYCLHRFLEGYNALDINQFRHKRINHPVCFSEGKNHINGIENFWSQAKRILRRYNGIERKFFPFF